MKREGCYDYFIAQKNVPPLNGRISYTFVFIKSHDVFWRKFYLTFLKSSQMITCTIEWSQRCYILSSYDLCAQIHHSVSFCHLLFSFLNIQNSFSFYFWCYLNQLCIFSTTMPLLIALFLSTFQIGGNINRARERINWS